MTVWIDGRGASRQTSKAKTLGLLVCMEGGGGRLTAKKQGRKCGIACLLGWRIEVGQGAQSKETSKAEKVGLLRGRESG